MTSPVSQVANPALGQYPTHAPEFPATANPTPGKAAAKKTYYSRVANIAFHVQRSVGVASVVQFHGNTYTTDDAVEIAQLDGACDVVGSPIYTKTPMIDPGEAAAQKELQDKAAKAAEAAGQANKPK